MKPKSAALVKNNFAADYLITMRPYLLFVSGITGAAGMSFSEYLTPFKISLVFTASFLSYGFGQALTDCFQIDTDSISSPYRPLTQGRLKIISVLIMSLAGLLFCIGVLAYYNPLNIYLGLSSAAGLTSYTYFKKKWWGGPFYNAWIIALLFIMSLLASGAVINYRILPAAAAVFFGYANFVLGGYFKDVEADRKTGYNTLPVVYGRKVSAIISDVFSASSIFSILFIFLNFKQIEKLPAAIFFIAGILSSLYAQVHLHKNKIDSEAHKAISAIVYSYLLLISSIVLFNKPEWTIFILLFIGCYAIVLKLRPAESQI